MKFSNILKSLSLLTLITLLSTGCGSLMLGTGSGSGASSSGSNSSYSESNEEAMVTAAIESLTSTTSSSESSSSSSYSSLTKSNSYLVVSDNENTSYATKAQRFRCEELSSVTESFSCDNSTGSMTRVVTFEDCDLDDTNKPGILNGSFTNTIENGGNGLCASFDHIDFAEMVMGRDDLNAIHTHTIGEEGMVFTLEGDDDAYITVTGTRQVTFTDAVDEDEDGAAEEVTATVVKSINRVTTVNEEEKHNVTVATLEDSFTPVDEEGAQQDEVSLTYPIHNLILDEDGLVDSRTVVSGQMVIDRSHSDLRIIMDVGEEGLTFYPQDHCGPYEGTAIITGYELDDDGNYVEVGSGQVEYANGEVQSAEYNGVELNLKPKPCS